MSGRGRGRGGFGRGAGGPPEIKDEDGQYVTKDVAGPPPLYPVTHSVQVHAMLSNVERHKQHHTSRSTCEITAPKLTWGNLKVSMVWGMLQCCRLNCKIRLRKYVKSKDG